MDGLTRDKSALQNETRSPQCHFRGAQRRSAASHLKMGGGVDQLAAEPAVREAVDAVNRLPTLDRATIRARFATRFSAERMARDYVQAYRRLLAKAREREFAPTA